MTSVQFVSKVRKFWKQNGPLMVRDVVWMTVIIVCTNITVQTVRLEGIRIEFRVQGLAIEMASTVQRMDRLEQHLNEMQDHMDTVANNVQQNTERVRILAEQSRRR